MALLFLFSLLRGTFSIVVTTWKLSFMFFLKTIYDAFWKRMGWRQRINRASGKRFRKLLNRLSYASTFHNVYPKSSKASRIHLRPVIALCVVVRIQGVQRKKGSGECIMVGFASSVETTFCGFYDAKRDEYLEYAAMVRPFLVLCIFPVGHRSYRSGACRTLTFRYFSSSEV